MYGKGGRRGQRRGEERVEEKMDERLARCVSPGLRQPHSSHTTTQQPDTLELISCAKALLLCATFIFSPAMMVSLGVFLTASYKFTHLTEKVGINDFFSSWNFRDVG